MSDPRPERAEAVAKRLADTVVGEARTPAEMRARDMIAAKLLSYVEEVQPYYDAVRLAHPGYRRGKPPKSPALAIRDLRQWSYEEGVESAQQEIERLRKAAKAP